MSTFEFDDVIGRAKQIVGVQQRIAKDVWPNGATLTCDRCGRVQSITSGQAGRYLAHGWPTCCDTTMTFSPARFPDDR